ncbi:hypothetical protein L486_08559 [Kwoniella mangroviensis CBS 10435]|uniref:DUF4048 domain-containing protein n=1 Tax=Kwoniella mangroviensis CBS 10435 TaxID=1331196 RepID=A0A1B9IE86_9TREE|nr:hypothetical protein L486_08559 [Kwoniella mangroviensis CBS 10435]
MMDKSTDHPYPSTSVPAPAPPANISRLQPHNNQQQHTLTSGNNKGLRPLGMSSTSTLNIPSSSTSPQIGGKSPLIGSSTKQGRRRSMIISSEPVEEVGRETQEQEQDDSSKNSSRNKLKRLSLCSRPPSLELIDHNTNVNTHNNPNTSTPVISPNMTSQPSTPLGGGGSTRRPDRRMGVRASISYSPAIPPKTAERKVFGRGDGWGMEEDFSVDGDAHGEREDGSEIELENVDRREGHRFTGVQTLAEKHADLLTHIAQRERRVAELKQELLTQENALAQLKSRWTTIVSRSALSPTQPEPIYQTHHTPPSRPSQSQSNRRRPVSMISTSTSTSSASSLSLATIDEPMPLSASALISSTGGLSNTGAAVLSGLISQTEGYLGPEVVQGGKRFLGNLWKTVGAAAGGTVPLTHQEPVIRESTGNITPDGRVEEEEMPKREDGTEWNHLSSKLDLANLQKLIIPWDTNTNVSSPSQRPPSSSSLYPSRRGKDRRPVDRSATVTPTSFQRRCPASPPATVGLGFDLNIKPSSTISTSQVSPKLLPERISADLLDGSASISTSNSMIMGLDDNVGDLGKALTPSKPKPRSTNKKIASTASSSTTSDDGWDW